MEEDGTHCMQYYRASRKGSATSEDVVNYTKDAEPEKELGQQDEQHDANAFYGFFAQMEGR